MNAAGRVLETVDKALGANYARDVAALKVWAKAFDLSLEDERLEDAVVECLQAVRSEVDLIELQLKVQNVPEDCFRQLIVSLRNCSSPSRLHSQWSATSDDLAKPNIRLALRWADWALQNTSENRLIPEEVSSLVSELDALEKLANESGLSEYLREFVTRQLAVVRRALRLYPIQGRKPIEDAVRMVAGSCSLERTEIEAQLRDAPSTVKSAMSKFGSVIEKTAKVADNLSKIKKAGEGAFSLAQAMGPAVLTLMRSINNS